MAGPTVKEILFRWGIDNSNWKKAISELSSMLDKANKDADKASDKATAKLEAQKAKLKEIVASQKSETAEIEKQIDKLKVKAAAAAASKADASSKLAAEKAATAEAGKQAALQKTLQANQKTLQQEINTKLMQEKLVTAEINRQSSALRLQIAQQRAAGGGGGGGRRPPPSPAAGGGGLFGGALKGIGGALLGGGIGATIFAATASAEGFGEALVHLTDKFKEFIESTGPLQQVREQFQKLAVTSGRDPVKFLEDLRGATHGLVEDMSLYRNANTFMQSGIKASQEDIVRLTAATVGLARAQGRDGTSAVQSLNRFFLTGRAMTLAYATGIQRTQLQLQGIGRSTDSATRATLQFKQALETITAQYKAIGEPALTFTDRLKQLEVAQHRFWEEIAIGLSQSPAFQAFLTDLGKLAENISSMAEGVGSWGAKLGGVFLVLEEAIKYIYQLFSQDFGIIGTFKDLLTEAFGPEISGRLLSFTGLLKTLGETFIILGGAARTFGVLAKSVLSGASAQEMKAALSQLYTETMDRVAEFEGKFQQSAKDRYKVQYAAPSNTFTPEQEMAAERKIAKAKEQIATESAKIQLEQTQMRIKKEEELVQVQYEQGLITIQQYLSKKSDLEAQDHTAKLTQLKQEFDAKMQYMAIEQSETRQLAEEKKLDAERDTKERLIELDRQKEEVKLRLKEDVKSGAISPRQAQDYAQTAAGQITAIQSLIKSSQTASDRQSSAELAELNANKLVAEKKYRADVLKEEENYQAKSRQLTEKMVTDEIAARQKLNDAILALEKSRIEISKENTEYDFQQGDITAQEYLEKRVGYIEDEFQASKDAAEKRLEENKNSEAAQSEFSQKMALAAEAREKELTKLSLNEIDIRTKAVEESYDRAQKITDEQLKYQQSGQQSSYFGGGKEEERALIEQEIRLLQSRLQEEVKSLRMIDEGSAAWFTQQEKIQQTKQALIQYNAELAKSHDLTTGIAAAIKELAGAAGKFPKGGGRVASGLGSFATDIEEQAQIRQRQAQRQAAAQARASGKGAAPVTPEQVFTSLKKSSDDAGSFIQKHLQDASKAVDEWRIGLVKSGVDLSSSIASLTKALINELIPAVQKAADAFVSVGGFYGGASAHPRLPGGGSGQVTAESPTGITTASDMENLQPAALQSSSNSPAAPALQASTALSKLAEVVKTLQGGFKDLVSNSVGSNGLVGFFKNLGKNTQQASDDLSNFTDMVSSIGGSIGQLQSAAKGTGGPMQSAMAGMAGGGALGSDIGGLFGPMGGMIGQGVGMGVGAVIGVFSGKAKKEAEKIAHEITAQFNAVLQEVQAGTLGLGSAVTQEINIIQSAVDQLSGKKGGRDTLKSILPQMEQQLLQLQQQQQQVIKSFDATVEQISAPEAQQAMVQPIQQIISTYQAYVLAGGNVATANDYLQASFKNLVTQGLDQLNQSEQDAINNALNYNDLLIQRQELIQSTNQQIQDVMSQGVAVRQMPAGVTKARQLQQIELNAQTQMDQLNEQIAVSQHKLDNEKQIFNLATTRVGLETQLIQLQDAQIDKQDASTTALLQEVQAFLTGTPTNLPTALGMIGLSGDYLNPSTEPGLKPTPPTPTGISWVDQQNELQYQQALAYYNQQAGLSGTATIASTASTIPGGAQGISIATGPGTPTAGLASSSAQLGGILDAMASNITAFPQAMAAVFSSASTIVNVGGTLLQNIAAALGVPGFGSAAVPVTTSSSPVSSLMRVAINKQGAATDSLVTASAQRQTIEENISSLSSTRVQSETQLVQLKLQEIQMDMERIQAWRDLLNAPARPGTNSQTLEDLLQSVYQTRARQGFGSFNGETSNAFT